MCGHSTLAHEPDSNFFENNDNALDTGGLRVNNEIMEEAEHGIVSALPCQKCDRDAKSLSTEKKNGDVGNVPELHEFVDVGGDSRNGRECQSGDFVSWHTIPVDDIKVPEKITDFYTDKSVTACKLPELIVRFKEGSYHVVKDICINEGVPCLDKILVENGEMGHKGLFGFSQSELDVDNGSIKGMVATAAPISDEVKPLDEYEIEMNVNQCSSNNLLDRDGKLSSRDKIVTEASDEKVVGKSRLLLVQVENNCPESSNFDRGEGQPQSDQDTSEEANVAKSMVHSAVEELNGHNANEIPFNSKMEKESITSNFDSSPPTRSCRMEDPQNADCHQRVQTLDSLILEDKILDGQTASSQSFYAQHDHGEYSFSAVGPLSGRVAHSGPISYSGSVSLRSDSSTNSTHSFAFPMLHSEWNSSPIRMEKADVRHSRRHQGWRRYLLCCKC